MSSTSKTSNLREQAIRRSAQKSKRPLFNNDTSANILPEIDDELERSIRRSDPDSRRNSSLVSLPQSPTVTDDEMREHFHLCLKLFAENKISQTNAWNLKIIDYMRIVLQNFSTNSLHVAGASLDTSAKIYGIRVDEIHSTGLKLASTMTRVEAHNEETNENVQVQGRQRENRRPRTRANKTTVVNDRNSLVQDIVKCKSNFLRISDKLAMSSTGDLLTKKLPMNYGGYALALPNEPLGWPTYTKIDSKINYEKTYPINLLPINNIELCGPFSNFAIDEWNPCDEEQDLLDDEASDQEVLNYDETGAPKPHLDGSIHDLFGDGEIGYQSNLEEDQDGPVNTNVVSFIGNCRPIRDIVDKNGYSFVDTIKLAGNKMITRICAGPHHWKLKYIRPRTAVCAGGQKKSRQVGKVKIQPANLYDEGPRFDMNDLYRANNRKINNPSKVTLPLSCNFTKICNRRPLLMKPDVYVEAKDELDLHHDSEDDSNDLQNLLDDGSRCETNNDDLMDVHLQSVASASQPAQNFHRDNLIEMPQLVEGINIPYASKAKRMDMKRLKNAICKILFDEETGAIKETRFSSIYKEIPKYISENMKKELSIHLALVSLLHVAAQYSLSLTQDPTCGIDDIIIGKANI